MTEPASCRIRTGREAIALVTRGLAIALLVLFTLLVFPAFAGASDVTVVARDLANPNPELDEYSFIVNADNTRDPLDSDPLLRPSMAPTESNSPIVAKGDQDSPTVTLPNGTLADPPGI